MNIIASCVEATDNFKLDRDTLYKENTKQKNTGYVSMHCNVLPFTQVDRLTYQPVVKKENDQSLSSESVLKSDKYLDNSMNNANVNLLDELVYEKGIESLLAIIYIDGNAMGDRIKELLKNETNYDKCVKLLRKFSLEIDEEFVKKPIAKIEEFLNNNANADAKKYNCKYRQIIGGGDEITIICNARIAADLLKEYFSSLSENPNNYACAGVAIFHSHAPFSTIYKIAEECCESGKRKARLIKGSKKNYVDFHFCHSGITNDLEVIREKQEAKLTNRPYEYKDFQEFMEKGKELNAIGRSNIKDLGQAILKNESSYQFEIHRINSLKNLENPLDHNDNNLKKTLFDISTVYDIWFDKKEEN